MLHPAVLGEMLDDEVAAAEIRLGSRAPELHRDEFTVTVSIGEDLLLVLDGSRYDVEPFRVTVTNTDGQPVRHEQWPGALSLGVHPILGRPFACVQGTYEYHAHPSHLDDDWARYRNAIRLPDLLDHLFRKAGL
jgi:hypothetical protein